MSEKEVIVVDLSKAIEKGIAIKVGNDLTVGSPMSKEAPKPIPKVEREVETYKGDPPRNADLKYHQEFEIPEKCDLKYVDRNGKSHKCEQKLRVFRCKREYFQPDEMGTGGTLEYDEDDVRQYKYCPLHGPDPPGPNNW